MASTQGSSYSAVISPPPPADLGSYARFMHQHTKRQMMESLAPSPPRSSSFSGDASPQNSQQQQQQQSTASPTGLPGGSYPGGSSQDRSRDSSQYRYEPSS